MHYYFIELKGDIKSIWNWDI